MIPVTSVPTYDTGRSASETSDVSGNMRVTSIIRPAEYGALGHYSISAVTGAQAAGAATKILFYCRNTHATNLALIKSVTIDGVIATTAFAAGQILYTLHVARAFSAEHASPGGTALTLTTNNAKLRTNMGTLGTDGALSVIRIATTASLATPATWTLDAQAVASLNSHSSAGVAAATPIIGSQYVPNNGVLWACGPGDHPIVLAQDEGVTVQATVPATGVWIAGITMKWAEVPRLSAV